MKIVFLIRCLDYGGAERQLVALACALHERGHDILVAVYYSNGPLKKELDAAGVPLSPLEKRDRWDVIGFSGRLVRLMHREKPDVLHSYLEGANVVGALLKPLFPQVRLVWGIRIANQAPTRDDRLTCLFYRLQRLLTRFPDRIIANSHAGREDAVSHGFPESKIMVVPNGIDVQRFHPDRAARHRLRATWGVSERETMIGRVGRLDPIKDYPCFLRAAALVARERPDVRFVCVGDGPSAYRRRLAALSEELGLASRLVWTGEREDMAAVYNALDMTVSSSLSEAFPNVIGEAMACGVPCVVTAVGDSAWIVGDCGVVVLPGSPKALACGIQSVLERDRHDLAARGRQRIMEHFSIQRLVEQTEQALWRKA